MKKYLITSDKEKQTYINNLERINDEQYKAIKDCKAYINECVRLQTIIDKAIEYTEENCLLNQGIDDKEIRELLNILKGEDK